MKEIFNRKSCCRCKQQYIFKEVDSGFNPSEYWCESCYRPWWKLVVDGFTRGIPGSRIELYQLLQEHSPEMTKEILNEKIVLEISSAVW